MAVQIIEAFAVHGDSGSERGRGPIEGYCRTRPDAEVMCVGRGWWGGPGAISSVHMLVTEGVMYALENPKPVQFMDAIAAQEKADADERERALAKLSPRERELLGFPRG